MDAAKTSPAAGGRPGTAGPAGTGRARARAYLDLWESNLVHVALHGPEPRPAPRPESSPPDARDDRRPPA